MRIPPHIHRIAYLEMEVAMGKSSIGKFEEVVKRAESGASMTGWEIEFLQESIRVASDDRPLSFSGPPDEMTNIVELSRFWLEIMKRDLEESKKALEKARKELKPGQDIQVFFGRSADRRSPEPW